MSNKTTCPACHGLGRGYFSYVCGVCKGGGVVEDPTEAMAKATGQRSALGAVGINGLTEVETSATASVGGLSSDAPGEAERRRAFNEGRTLGVKEQGMNCHGLFGRLFGHCYQPRYSKSAPTYALQTIENLVFAEEVALILETSKAVTYRCDVCTRCGNVLKESA